MNKVFLALFVAAFAAGNIAAMDGDSSSSESGNFDHTSPAALQQNLLAAFGLGPSAQQLADATEAVEEFERKSPQKPTDEQKRWAVAEIAQTNHLATESLSEENVVLAIKAAANGGVDLNEPILHNPDGSTRTPLEIAALYLMSQATKALLECGATPTTLTLNFAEAALADLGEQATEEQRQCVATLFTAILEKVTNLGSS